MDASSRLWALWREVAGDSAASREAWSELVERWSEPHRAYHTLEHLLLMLELLAERDADAETMLAAWYHDAVYDPRSTSNEADSATLATEALQALPLAIDHERVADLILATASHEAPPGDIQAQLLLDADLAILGQPPAHYLRYVEGVRREYAHVADDDFRAGRSAILHELAGRERLYAHESFTHLEQPARANLTAELSLYGR